MKIEGKTVARIDKTDSNAITLRFTDGTAIRFVAVFGCPEEGEDLSIEAFELKTKETVVESQVRGKPLDFTP